MKPKVRSSLPLRFISGIKRRGKIRKRAVTRIGEGNRKLPQPTPSTTLSDCPHHFDGEDKRCQQMMKMVEAMNNHRVGKEKEYCKRKRRKISSNSIIKKKDWNLWIDVGKNVVRRENIEAAVKRVMDGGDDNREG
ncbi:hypothetical protein TEA_022680 [Camellia sinensis var. sinensis]|uniref:Uncharacterized protein n=1 Tax=Camellia sinensis var. sinensis TaxID=542762 RepID=A0A4S4EX39_CAMSN|nr:hypothetical protein TEA_022680 [Camellia sinensis var. sinensis]